MCLEPAAQGGHEKEADMRRTHLITTAALVAACAVPATAAAHYGQNLQSPDTRDAAANAKVDYSMNAAGGAVKFLRDSQSGVGELMLMPKVVNRRQRPS